MKEEQANEEDTTIDDAIDNGNNPYFGGDEIEADEAEIDRGDLVEEATQEVSDDMDEVELPAGDAPDAVSEIADGEVVETDEDAAGSSAETVEAETSEAETDETEEVVEETTKRAPMIPRSRFDQVNNRLKAATQKLESMEAAAANGEVAPSVAEQQKDDILFQEEIVTEQQAIHDLLLDGNSKDAAAKQTELNGKMMSRATSTARDSVRDAVNENQAKRDFDAQLVVLETDYGFINPDNTELYDESMVTRVKSISNALRTEGYTASEALAEATTTVAARFYPDLLGTEPSETAPDTSVADGKRASMKTATIKKNLKAANKQPAKIGGESLTTESASLPSISEMSESEFEDLSELELQRLRGDVA